jgi:hypothetical protein
VDLWDRGSSCLRVEGFSRVWITSNCKPFPLSIIAIVSVSLIRRKYLVLPRHLDIKFVVCAVASIALCRCSYLILNAVIDYTEIIYCVVEEHYCYLFNRIIALSLNLRFGACA